MGQLPSAAHPYLVQSYQVNNTILLYRRMGSSISKYDDLELATAEGGLEPLPTGGRWVRDSPTKLYLKAEALSWTRADCSIYEGEDASGPLLFRIEHNDLRDRAVFDSDGQELPTGYMRKMTSIMDSLKPVARIYWEVEGKVMVFATVKKTGSMMKPSFGVFMHNPPVHIEDCDSLELENPAFRVEATLGGHFVILQGDEDEKLVKVANVRKDNYNINIMENFPMDIEIGPQMDLLFLCLVIGAVQEINAQQSGQSG